MASAGGRARRYTGRWQALACGCSQAEHAQLKEQVRRGGGGLDPAACARVTPLTLASPCRDRAAPGWLPGPHMLPLQSRAGRRQSCKHWACWTRGRHWTRCQRAASAPCVPSWRGGPSSSLCMTWSPSPAVSAARHSVLCSWLAWREWVARSRRHADPAGLRSLAVWPTCSHPQTAAHRLQLLHPRAH